MSSILFDINHQVAIIRLNRPDVFNAFNQEAALLLQQYLDECKEHDQIRAVLITGNGKAFCAGQDLNEVVDPEGPALKDIVGKHYNPIIQKMRQLPKPIVVAVNGVAAGAGANIALAGDLVCASENASFIQAFSKIGLIPDSGGTYTLPRLIGMQRASALMMLGDKLSAHDALQMGMIYKVFEHEFHFESSLKIAEQLSHMPTKALAYTKQALNHSWEATLDEQLALEEILQEKSAQTYDYNEGVSAFLEKRKPVFEGR